MVLGPKQFSGTKQPEYLLFLDDYLENNICRIILLYNKKDEIKYIIDLLKENVESKKLNEVR